MATRLQIQRRGLEEKVTLQKFGVLLVVLAAVVTMPACGAIFGIFKAGMGVGIFMAILVVGLIFFVITKARA
jgi:hypothetical protein